MSVFLIAGVLLAALALWPLARVLWRSGGGRGFAVGAPVAVLVLALGLYSALGSPAVFDPALMTSMQADAMVTRLAAHMQKNPGNAEGWLLLARSQSLLGRDREAALAYERRIALGPVDAAVAQAYADVMARLQIGKPGK